MRVTVVSLVFLGIIALMAWEYAPAPCCPPPPVTTGPIRSLPRSDRTSPPASNITLPPTTHLTSTGLTQPPSGNITGPITATERETGQRTTIQQTTNRTEQPSNRTYSTNTGGRSVNATPTPSQNRSVAVSAIVASTVAPTSINFSASDVARATSYFGWEDWWKANNSYFLHMFTSEDKVYVSTLDPQKDVPRLLTMFCYRGLFDKGVQGIAVNAMRGIGDNAVDILISIVEEKYKFEKDVKHSRFNVSQYEEAAIRALGYIGGTKAGDAVAALLMPKRENSPTTLASKADDVLNRMAKDKSMGKRFWACEALGRIGDPAYLPVLENALNNDSDKYVRSAAAEAIARIGGSTAITMLRKGYDESKSYYQAKTYVAASLGFLGSTDPIEDIRVASISEDGNIRAASALALAYVIRKRLDAGKDYGSLLTSYIHSLDRETDENVRRSIALGATIMITKSEMFEPMKKYLTDGRDPSVRAIFALAYSFTGDPTALPYLTALPVDADPVAETGRGYAVALLISTSKVKLATDLLSESSPILVACGIVKSAEFLGEEGFRTITEQRSVKEDIVQRSLAYVSAVNLGKKGFEQAVKYTRGREEAARAVAFVALGIRNDAEALEELKRWEKATDKELKKSINIGTAMMSGLQLADSIKTALSDAKEQVRCAAIVSLGNLNRPETIDTILEKIDKDSNYRVRAYACAALANVKIPPADTERVVNALIKAAKTDKEYMVRGYAAYMLSMFKENRAAFETVRAVVADKNTDAAAMAAFSLGLFGNPAGAGDLRALLQKGRGTPIAYAARIGIGLIGDESNAADLIAEFKYLNQTQELESAAFAIARSATRNTYADMLKYVDNEDIYIREYSIKCLGMMKNLSDEARGAIAEKLATLEKDSDGNVRFYAAVVRYSLGDRAALSIALSAIYEKNFQFNDGSVSDNDARTYYAILTDMVNETMPGMYRIKPYFWGEGEEE
ncbi:MAG: HEAT repeat domain-containing protein [Candidatus Brocadiia bacterium]